MEDAILMFETVGKLCFQVAHESIRSVGGVFIEVIQEAVSQISILSHHIVEVLHSFLTHSVLVGDIILHILTLILNFFYDLFLVGHSCFLFLDEAFLDRFDLGSDWIQVIIVVLNAVNSFLINALLTLVHASMIACPMLSEDVCFFINLPLEVVAKILELLLEALLKLVNNVMNMVHRGDSLLSVFPYLFICIIKLFLHLSFVFDTGVLEHLEAS